MKKLFVVIIAMATAFLSFEAGAESELYGLPGYLIRPLYSRAGNPSAYLSGIQGFDYDGEGNLYVFADNQIIKDPQGSAEVLFNYQTTTTIYGSFVKVRGDTVYFGESSTATIRSVPVSGGPSRPLFTLEECVRPPSKGRTGLEFNLAGNYDCAFDSQTRMFLSANPGGFSGENKIYYWDGQTDPVVIAEMGKYSGPLAFDRNDNLYYGFTGYPAGPEDAVYFTAVQVDDAISSGVPLTSSDWSVYAAGVDAFSGLAFDNSSPVQQLFSSSSTGALSRITGPGSFDGFGVGSSPSYLRFEEGTGNFAAFGADGGRLSVLCTYWPDYSSAIFVVEPCFQNYLLGSGDYDGDGASEIAVFRGSSGLWAVRGVTRTYFGAAGDLPVSGDYNGDGTSEIAVFRPRSGLWALSGSGRIYFGTEGDIPLPMDYNNDGTADIALFRPDRGLWAVRGVTRTYFGAAGDFPVPEDYDGDGTAEFAVYRPSAGLWSIQGTSRLYFGSPGDLPVPGDYDEDGTAEVVVFRPSEGLWAVRGGSRFNLGEAGDWPEPLDYDGDGALDPAIFRPVSGLWAVKDATRIYFGGRSDLPVGR